MIKLDLSPGFGYLPVFWALFTSFTFLLCYTIAVSLNHIYPFVPAISDTGARIPEANLFSEFFNFSALLLAVSVFVRYLQFQMLTKGFESSDLRLSRLNKFGLGFGLVSAFGGTIIANFPSNEVSPFFGVLRHAKIIIILNLGLKCLLHSCDCDATLNVVIVNKVILYIRLRIWKYWTRPHGEKYRCPYLCIIKLHVLCVLIKKVHKIMILSTTVLK